MEHSINNLITILESESKFLDEILSFSNKKTRAIIENNIEELENTEKIEKILINDLNNADIKREEITNEIAKIFNIEAKEINISTILNYLTSDYASQIKQLQDKMTFLLKEIKYQNELNSILIKNALEYATFSINLISNTNTGNNNYGNNGIVKDSEKRKLFDYKV